MYFTARYLILFNSLLIWNGSRARRKSATLWRKRREERGVSALVCARSKYSKFGRNFQVYFYEAHGSIPLWESRATRPEFEPSTTHYSVCLANLIRTRWSHLRNEVAHWDNSGFAMSLLGLTGLGEKAVCLTDHSTFAVKHIIGVAWYIINLLNIISASFLAEKRGWLVRLNNASKVLLNS